ncbi:hypothetical protein BGX30_006148, partial [Mortierella sp. GBA39]
RWYVEAKQDDPGLEATLDAFPWIRANTKAAMDIARVGHEKPTMTQEQYAARMRELFPRPQPIVSKTAKSNKAVAGKIIGSSRDIVHALEDMDIPVEDKIEMSDTLVALADVFRNAPETGTLLLKVFKQGMTEAGILSQVQERSKANKTKLARAHNTMLLHKFALALVAASLVAGEVIPRIPKATNGCPDGYRVTQKCCKNEVPALCCPSKQKLESYKGKHNCVKNIKKCVPLVTGCPKATFGCPEDFGGNCCPDNGFCGTVADKFVCFT